MTVRDLVSIALFAAFFIALGLIPGLTLPVMPGVPIVMQSIAVMLAGALLGSKRAFLCMVVIWVLVAAGLPILAGGRGGLAVFAGPTAGYLIGYGFGAALIGFLFERSRHNLTMLKIIAFLALGGIVVTYSMGILWLYIITDGASMWGLILANLVFLPGNVLKMVICYIVIRIINKSLPDAFLSGR